MSNGTTKHVSIVAGIGAVGGLLGWGFALWLDMPGHIGERWDLLLSVALGAGASVIFVFVIANTDRTDGPRLIGLALLAGFFWEPVWEAGRALIGRELEQNR